MGAGGEGGEGGSPNNPILLRPYLGLIGAPSVGLPPPPPRAVWRSRAILWPPDRRLKLPMLRSPPPTEGSKFMRCPAQSGVTPLARSNPPIT